MKTKSQRFSLKSFVYALKGIQYLFKTQPNARFHFLATIVVIALGFLFQIHKFEWIAIVVCIGAVISAEAFNTAIEQLVDLVHPDWDDRAGRVKDVAAGAVLFFAIAASVVGLLIFLPKMLSFF